MTPEEELEIAALGAQGDGVARTDGGVRYVAYALPGERVAAKGEGLPRLISAPSPDRVAPLCRHFGTCGGCAAQHMGGELYADWKRGLVVEALRRHGLAPEVAPLRRVGPGTRRRAVLTARRQGGRVALGYHRRRSTEIVDIAECPVLDGAVADKLPALRAIAGLLAVPEVRLTVLATPAGLDVAVETGGSKQGSGRSRGRPLASKAGKGLQTPREGADRVSGPGSVVSALAGIATAEGLARIAVNGETVVERKRPILPIGEVEVAVPPGAFIQAVQSSEEMMRALVMDALDGSHGRIRQVADLFCGVGTFTFALARRARVLALDGDAAAVAALAAAARHAKGLKPVEARVRDLLREPLSARELQPFDAVVFDPPRAGAHAQALQLARSQVETVVAVSCDPGTLARDTQVLAGGGYAVASVTPIDQFVLSAHVEIVAVLRRTPGRRGAARRPPSAS